MATIESVVELRRALGTLGTPDPLSSEDYQIAASLGGAFLARTRSSAPAFLIPLETAPTVAGRRGGGFSLFAASRVAFNHDGRRWQQPAAVIECTDSDLVETFLVLVVDIVRRLTLTPGVVTWLMIMAWVEEWQALLARRITLTAEQQVGLWGELWLISSAMNPDRLIAGWRGPEREAVDFFVNGIAVEVKTSRNAHLHHISQSQVDRPTGAHPPYVLSLWVGVDPVAGVSLKELAENLLSRVADPPALLKQMALAGYVPQDSGQYLSRFLPLEPPSWFRGEDVPRVREIDPGILNIRYTAQLDIDKAMATTESDRLWRTLCGAAPSAASGANPLCD